MTAPDIVLFDGVCGFCDRAVRLIMATEREPNLKFAPMQSPTGRTLMAQHGINPDDDASYVLISGGTAYLRSDATIRIARRLRAPWRWMTLLRFIPRPLRDAGYNVIARNRYRWFGKYDACRLMTPELNSRFLEGSTF